MPSLKAFRRMAGLPDSIRRWSDAARHVKGLDAEVARLQMLAMEDEPMDRSITVDWRAVSHNAPSRNMPRVVPWVHGLIRDAKGPSPRVELSPKRQTKEDAPIHCIIVAPDQAAAETMDWDAKLDMTIDGHAVSFQKSMGPTHGWCDGDHWSLVAELDADHPLVVHAAEAAKAPQAAMDEAQDAFYAAAREWGDANFPHPDFMNVVRRLVYDEWNGRADYWPGDPLPDVEAICAKAREQLRA